MKVFEHRVKGQSDRNKETECVPLGGLDLFVGENGFISLICLETENIHVFAEVLDTSVLAGFVPQAYSKVLLCHHEILLEELLELGLLHILLQLAWMDRQDFFPHENFPRFFTEE